MKQISMLLTVSASSRDTKPMLSIEKAMNSADFKEILNPNIRFYFANQTSLKQINRLAYLSVTKN